MARSSPSSPWRGVHPALALLLAVLAVSPAVATCAQLLSLPVQGGDDGRAPEPRQEDGVRAEARQAAVRSWEESAPASLVPAALRLARDAGAPPVICIAPAPRDAQDGAAADDPPGGDLSAGELAWLEPLLEEAVRQVAGAEALSIVRRDEASACRPEAAVVALLVEISPQPIEAFYAFGPETGDRLEAFQLVWTVALRPSIDAPSARLSGTAPAPDRIPAPDPRPAPPGAGESAEERDGRRREATRALLSAERLELAEELFAELGLPGPSPELHAAHGGYRPRPAAEEGPDVQLALRPGLLPRRPGK